MKPCSRLKYCAFHTNWLLNERWDGEAAGWCTASNFRMCKNKPKKKSSYLSTKSDESEGTVKRNFGRGRRFGRVGKK